MTFTARMAWRYLWGRKLRTTLTTLAIVLSVMVVFGLNGMLPALQEAFRQNLMAAASQVDLTLTSETRSAFGAEALAVLRDTPGVAHATGTLVLPVILPAALAPATSDGAPLNSFMVVGVDPVSVEAVRPIVIAAGRSLQPDDGAVVLISEQLAQRTGLQPGDSLRLPASTGSSSYTIVGLVRGRPNLEAEEVIVPLTAAQALFGLPGQINTLEALFQPGQDADVVRATALARLGAGFRVGGNEAGGEMQAAVQMGGAFFGLLGLMALVMGAFIILNTFRTVVAERRQDIGLLRSVGASRGTVIRLILVECLLQGVVGTAVGLLAGYAFVTALLTGMSDLMQDWLRVRLAGPSFSLQTWALAISVGMGMTALGGIIPARAASRVPPLEALRPSQAEVSWAVSRRRAWVGALLIALAVLGLISNQLALASLGAVLFLVGLLLAGPALVYPITRVFGGLLTRLFAREGQIAQGNVQRQPGRAAITASTMMIGLAILVAMGGLSTTLVEGMTQWVSRSLGADFLLMPQSLVLSGGNVGASPQLAEAMRGTAGVAEVTSLRLGSARAADLDLQIVGIDPQTYPEMAGLEFASGDPEEAYTALAGGRALILNGIFALQARAKLGDTLTLQTPSGPQAYTVVGIGSDFLNVKLATGFVSQANLATDWGVTNDVLLMANLEEGADAAQVEAALRPLVDAYPAFALHASAAWRDQTLTALSTQMSMIYVLMIALAVPSLVALVNTLGINVLERTREIGVLRAVGATRRQVKRMILAESLLLAAIGTAFGLLAGLWLGWILVGAMSALGFALPYYFPWAGILLAAAVGLLFGTLAALIPARQAARLEIVTALQYE